MDASNLEYFWTSFWDIATWSKLGILLVTSRWWWPSVRGLWREFNEVLAPGGGLFGRNEPRPIEQRGLHNDPFLNIPLEAYRLSRTAGKRERQHEIVPARRREPSRASSPRSARSPRAVMRAPAKPKF